MATEKAIINLTVQTVVNGYQKDASSKAGTLIIFNELHDEPDLKGKPICKWNSDPSHEIRSRNGFTYDPNTRRVSTPVVTLEEKEDRTQDRKLKALIEAGVEFKV